MKSIIGILVLGGIILGFANCGPEHKTKIDITVSGEVVGQWWDSLTQGVYVMGRNNESYVMHRAFADGSSMTEELIKNQDGREVRYNKLDDHRGEYYTINPNGTLNVCDREGVIITHPIQGAVE